MITTIIDLHSPVVQALIILIIVTILTVISLIKFYAYITCGYYRKMDRMLGKTVIITGASSGIGKETAREIAKRGAKVILACRNLTKAEAIKDEIIKITDNRNVIIKQLDLSSQKSIREFAEDILKNEKQLDVLVHNAGTAENKMHLTEEGLELTMATNHFGPMLLTHLLIDLLKKSAPSRIVIVASELYRLACLNPDKLNPTNTFFTPYLYYVSKYANICFTVELAKRLQNSGVTVNCLHPGMIDSGIWRNVPVPFNWFLQLIIKSFFKTPEQGCQTSVYLACSPEVEGINGKYFMDCKESRLSSGASSPDKARKVWENSMKYLNLQNDDPKI